VSSWLLVGIVGAGTVALFASGTALVVDARVAGVAAVIIAIVLRAPILVVIVVAAVAAAATRALS